MRKAQAAFPPFSDVGIDLFLVHIVVPAAVENIDIRAVCGDKRHERARARLLGGIPGEVHILVENDGKFCIRRAEISRKTAVACHLLHDSVKARSEAERRAAGKILFPRGKALFPAASCKRSAAQREIERPRAAFRHFPIPAAARLDLEKQKLFVFRVLNDRLRKLLFGRPAPRIISSDPAERAVIRFKHAQVVEGETRG